MVRARLLHLCARGLLRLASPRRAHAIMLRIGTILPALTSAEELQNAVMALGNAGTCLSRSLVIACWTPASEVVIGVELRPEARLLAHAWVEVAGEVLQFLPPVGREIARLPGRSRR